VTGGFRKLGEKTIHQGHTIGLALGEFEAPDGTRFEREIVHHPGAVAMVPLHDDGTVTLVRQYRAPLDALLLELPAGKRDVEGEPPEHTAHRELEEEVGLRAGRLDLLVSFHNSPGFSDELVIVYLAQDLTEVPPARDGVEEQSMTIERIALADAPRLINGQELTDAKTIIGLLMTLDRLRAADG
jgi:ADP-ribose pyrophosphatase